MNESLLINISIALLFLPLLGFATVIFLGKKVPKIYLFEVFIVGIALIATMALMFVKLAYYQSHDIIMAFNWFSIGIAGMKDSFTVELGIKLDNLAVIMLFVVYLISFLVHLYSIEYMRGDKRYNRYFAYLGIFTFSMLGIVLTHNILMMYIFWELVGLSSYLLIGFWFEKKSASDAGKKAFLVNRVGDIGMFIGIMILFTHYKTFTFDTIFAQMALGNIPFNSTWVLTATGILIFMGAVGKSAQFPLHVWLPDAMEGPTPVSALIHAATMVAAGVYLLTKIFVMLTADAMLTIAVIGGITSFVAATIAITQNDIKKVLAYSTVSQLGYMVLSIGVGAYAFAFFHLVTHAFFKACLFLGSGSVIHSMHHEQDIREMGGLRKKMPITYYTFLVATLAISGIPLTSGFLSKDSLLAGTLAFGKLTGHWLLPAIGFLVAALTAFYMFRLVILTFHGKPKNQHKFDHAHESPFVMAAPLVVLATLSIFFFYTPNPLSAGDGWFISDWVKTPHTVVPASAAFDFMVDHSAAHSAKAINNDAHSATNSSEAVTNKSHSSEANSSAHGEITHSELYTETMHWAHYPAMFASLIVAGLGILLAFVFYQWRKVDADKLAESIKPIYKFSLNKWYIDEIYNATVIAGTLVLARFLSLFDGKVVDGAVNGAGHTTKFISRLGGWFDTFVVDGFVNFTAFVSGFIGLSFRRLQTGKVQTYLVLVIFSVIIILLVIRPF
ncbi:NADH-quinone oxidoreductase subunit L [bacterium BRH_c32]|nr:MAG: NADH-quinone oxidoreductase subunit L [bacterium BRH_c32]